MIKLQNCNNRNSNREYYEITKFFFFLDDSLISLRQQYETIETLLMMSFHFQAKIFKTEVNRQCVNVNVVKKKRNNSKVIEKFGVTSYIFSKLHVIINSFVTKECNS